MKDRLGLWAAFAAGVHFFVVLCFTVMQPHVAKAEQADKGVILARRLEDRGRIKEAGALLEKIASSSYRSSPSAPEAMMELARFDLRHRHDAAKALAGLDELTELYPTHPESKTAQKYADFIRGDGGPGSVPLQLYFTAVGASRAGDHSAALEIIDRIGWQHRADTIAPYALYQGYYIASSRLHDPARANKYLGELQSRFSQADWRELASVN